MTEPLERRACITGAAQSQVGRRIYRSPLDLTVEGALRAIEDAGLTRDDIDGLASYPGAMAVPPGFSGPGTPEVQDALRLNLNWHAGGAEGPAQISAVINAINAVATGLARHVLVYRTVTEASAQGTKGRASVSMGAGMGGGGRVSGFLQWTLPFGAFSAGNWLAMYAARHFHEFGTTREQLAQIPLTARKNAALNPQAIYTEPMTLDDYFAARMVSWPFCLFDCDVPADGCTAVIVSSVDCVDDAPHPGVRVNAVGSALHGRPSWDQWDDITTFACRDAAAQMWSRTDLKPGDVDTAQMYDGFSFLTLAWIEALGFCAKGEGGPFIEGGTRIARDGELPINTSGGQLSAGRLHGFGHLWEAVNQVRGTAGERQVPDVDVAVAAAGGGPLAGCLLLTK